MAEFTHICIDESTSTGTTIQMKKETQLSNNKLQTYEDYLIFKNGSCNLSSPSKYKLIRFRDSKNSYSFNLQTLYSELPSNVINNETFEDNKIINDSSLFRYIHITWSFIGDFDYFHLATSYEYNPFGSYTSCTPLTDRLRTSDCNYTYKFIHTIGDGAKMTIWPIYRILPNSYDDEHGARFLKVICTKTDATGTSTLLNIRTQAYSGLEQDWSAGNPMINPRVSLSTNVYYTNVHYELRDYGYY